MLWINTYLREMKEERDEGKEEGRERRDGEKEVEWEEKKT